MTDQANAADLDGPNGADVHGPHGLGENEVYDRAWRFVVEHQGEQLRKGTNIRYTTHLRGAAKRVHEDGGTPDEVVAAMLHDVIEDTPVVKGGTSIELEDVRRDFGDRVAEIVDFCTDAAPPPGEPKDPWRLRKEAHFEHLRGGDPGTLRVVVADKTDNITSQIDDIRACDGDLKIAESLARFKGGFAGTLWYYRNMRAAMGDELAGSTLFDEFTSLIEEFASIRTPSAAELHCRDRVRRVLDRIDPNEVGRAAVAAGYYSIDADELARRTHAPGAPEEVIVSHVDKWYVKRDRSSGTEIDISLVDKVWDLPTREALARSLLA
jgi:GTP pyrophosphokinase